MISPTFSRGKVRITHIWLVWLLDGSLKDAIFFQVYGVVHILGPEGKDAK